MTKRLCIFLRTSYDEMARGREKEGDEGRRKGDPAPSDCSEFRPKPSFRLKTRFTEYGQAAWPLRFRISYQHEPEGGVHSDISRCDTGTIKSVYHDTARTALLPAAFTGHGVRGMTREKARGISPFPAPGAQPCLTWRLREASSSPAAVLAWAPALSPRRRLSQCQSHA